MHWTCIHCVKYHTQPHNVLARKQMLWMYNCTRLCISSVLCVYARLYVNALYGWERLNRRKKYKHSFTNVTHTPRERGERIGFFITANEADRCCVWLRSFVSQSLTRVERLDRFQSFLGGRVSWSATSVLNLIVTFCSCVKITFVHSRSDLTKSFMDANDWIYLIKQLSRLFNWVFVVFKMLPKYCLKGIYVKKYNIQI